jgi:hypothetical protein
MSDERFVPLAETLRGKEFAVELKASRIRFQEACPAFGLPGSWRLRYLLTTG